MHLNKSLDMDTRERFVNVSYLDAVTWTLGFMERQSVCPSGDKITLDICKLQNTYVTSM